MTKCIENEISFNMKLYSSSVGIIYFEIGQEMPYDHNRFFFFKTIYPLQNDCGIVHTVKSRLEFLYQVDIIRNIIQFCILWCLAIYNNEKKPNESRWSNAGEGVTVSLISRILFFISFRVRTWPTCIEKKRIFIQFEI